MEKDFSCIKIKEIAERAGLNRVTFYDHYESKEALLAELTDEVLCEYAEILNNAASPDTKKIIRLSIRHIRKHADFYKVMLLTGGVPNLQNRLHDLMSDAFHRLFKQYPLSQPPVNSDMFIDWIIGGSIGVFKYMLQNEDQLSDEEASRQLFNITLAGSQAIHPRMMV